MALCRAQRVRQFSTGRAKVYGWGSGQVLAPMVRDTPSAIASPVRLDIAGVPYAIASGWGHSLVAVQEQERTHRILSFGLNRSGQLGFSMDEVDSAKGFVKGIPQESRIISMACGREHSMVIAQDESGHHELYAFGNNMYGQLGLGESRHNQTRQGTFVIRDSASKVTGYEGSPVQLTCGLDHTVFVTDAQKVYAMGWGADGQLGVGPHSTSDKDTPTRLARFDNKSILKLASSTDYTFALLEDRTLWVWGNSEYGQAMQGRKIDRILEPMQVPIKHDIKDIACGGPFSLVLTTEGSVLSCGYGVLGQGEQPVETLEPLRIRFPWPITQIFATTDYAACIDDAGQLYTFGLNGPHARLGLGDTAHAFEPRKVLFEDSTAVRNVALGMHHALVLS
ncbi:hypothetical protein BZG36_02283 [Bifiguratus adelaidae]|uniref:Uncharacterized protein n=1 Tax=Bifiguratus adelaidae TaxID=1938954 RepID=A0A261XYB2_9FUNG|nr:hypothetical protein BZG36_02283 [Bifiguratus adelaidae]